MKKGELASILVPVSGEPSDDDAVKLACELLSSQKGRLYVLYVIEVEWGLPLDAEVAPATAKGEEVLGHMEEGARPYKHVTQAEFLQARRAGAAVVQEAVDKQVDAIVVGVPYKKAYGSFSIGETAPYILKNAPCRVILWRGVIPENPPQNGHRS